MSEPAEFMELMRLYRIAQERRGLLAGGIDKRETYAKAFARWMAPLGLFDATRQDIESFLDKRRNRQGHKISARTRYHWISDFHEFYDWAVKEGLAATDPTVKIVRPKIRRTLPRPIDRGDLDFAIRAARPQMRAMLLLAAFAGLRVQEIAGLDREDIIEARGLIHVRRGKGGKERLVPLHPDTLVALRNLPMPKAGRLFERPMGGRQLPETLSLAISDHLRGLGINATAHQCRHFFATEIYAKTHDLRMTQELLGHAFPSTTAGYVAWSPANAAAAVGALKIGTKRTPGT